MSDQENKIKDLVSDIKRKVGTISLRLIVLVVLSLMFISIYFIMRAFPVVGAVSAAVSALLVLYFQIYSDGDIL